MTVHRVTSEGHFLVQSEASLKPFASYVLIGRRCIAYVISANEIQGNIIRCLPFCSCFAVEYSDHVGEQLAKLPESHEILTDSAHQRV